MSPALYSWLLMIPYVLAGVAIIYFAWSAGGLLYCLLNPARHIYQPSWFSYKAGSGFFLLAARITCGLALFSWITAILGVTGFFIKLIVLPALLLLTILGAAVGWRYGTPLRPLLLQDWLLLGRSWQASTRIERWLGGAIILWLSALAVNALIGAMVPEFTIDPLWYHLSVPQQWIFDQRFAAYPSVMPSAYPLAADTLFAILLLLAPGNSVLCTTFTVMACFVWLCGTFGAALMVASRNMSYGWAAAAVLGIWCPLIMLYGMTAPVWLKNDLLIVMITFVAVALIWLPILADRKLPPWNWWFCAGFLLGTASCAKATVLGLSAINLLFALFACVFVSGPGERITSSRKILPGLGICLAVMAAAMAPWLVRGYTTHGIPLFPIGIDLFRANQEFKPLISTFSKLHWYEIPKPGDLPQQLKQFGEAMIATSSNRDKCIFLYLVVSVLGLIFGSGVWRLFAANLALMLFVFVGMKGREDIFRFFTPAYGIASLLIAWFVARYARLISAPARCLIGVIALAGCIASFSSYQYRVATSYYFNWKFRPLLSPKDVDQYAAHAEHGDSYLDFREIAPFISEDERVLLIGSPFPFYLHRDTLWDDPVITTGGLKDRWSKMTLAEALSLIKQKNLEVLLLRREKDGTLPGPVEELADQKIVTPVQLPEAVSHWTLWRVDGAG